MAERGDFYEDDEPVADVVRAFEGGEPFVTELAVSFTPEEAAFICWAAEARGVTLSAFLRECALEKAAQPVVRWLSPTGAI